MPQASPQPGGALALTVPSALVDAIAGRVVELLDERGAISGTSTSSPWLDADEAAAYLRCAKQRVYDLVSAGALERAGDGRRLLFHRDALDAYVFGSDA